MFDRRLFHEFGEQEHISRTAAGYRGDRVQQGFVVHPCDLADGLQQTVAKCFLRRADVGAGTANRDALPNRGWRVGHRPDDRGGGAKQGADAGDGPAALLLACASKRSMRWMLQGAGVAATGLRGEIQVRGLLAVWLYAVRAWERDESEDLSATMAAIDKALDRAEKAASWLNLQRPGPAAQAAPDEAFAAATPASPATGLPEAEPPEAEAPEAGA